MKKLHIISNTQISGDPLDPSSGDTIAQMALLDVGDRVPDGWRVLSGNMHSSTIARVVLRYEVQSDSDFLEIVRGLVE